MAIEMFPGFNHPDWKGTIQCLATQPAIDEDRYGCGTTFEITRDDLYVSKGRDCGGMYRRVIFHCPQCHLLNVHPQSDHFADLPDVNIWLQTHPDIATAITNGCHRGFIVS